MLVSFVKGDGNGFMLGGGLYLFSIGFVKTKPVSDNLISGGLLCNYFYQVLALQLFLPPGCHVKVYFDHRSHSKEI